MTSAPASVEESVVIKRRAEDVFAFYKDFRNLPQFLGDVMRIEPGGDRIWRWTVQGPLGLAVRWNVIVTEQRPNAFIAFQTAAKGAPTRWELNFLRSGNPVVTTVREAMWIPGGWLSMAALAAIGKPPAKEVRANLQRLKELLETGRVTTTDYAVAGKFGTAPVR